MYNSILKIKSKLDINPIQLKILFLFLPTRRNFHIPFQIELETALFSLLVTRKNHSKIDLMSKTTRSLCFLLLLFYFFEVSKKLTNSCSGFKFILLSDDLAHYNINQFIFNYNYFPDFSPFYILFNPFVLQSHFLKLFFWQARLNVQAASHFPINL